MPDSFLHTGILRSFDSFIGDGSLPPFDSFVFPGALQRKWFIPFLWGFLRLDDLLNLIGPHRTLDSFGPYVSNQSHWFIRLKWFSSSTLTHSGMLAPTDILTHSKFMDLSLSMIARSYLALLIYPGWFILGWLVLTLTMIHSYMVGLSIFMIHSGMMVLSRIMIHSFLMVLSLIMIHSATAALSGSMN
jgi:hypothetical protein